MNKTKIQWTNYTSNPLKFRNDAGETVWACIHKSEGCRNCYAEKIAMRYKRGGPFTAPVMEKLTPFLDDKELHHMLTYKPASGKMCFVGDMTDCFGEWVPDELLHKLFAVFAIRHDVIWQILTKRSDRMMSLMNDPKTPFKVSQQLTQFAKPPMPIPEHIPEHLILNWPLRNVWSGVSCEDQKTADERTKHLRNTPAAVRFISYEPALSAVNFNLNGISWVIVGGESGQGSRPFNIQWARHVIGECRATGTACFVKQLGRYPFDHREPGLQIDDSSGGDVSEWPQDLRVREFPTTKETIHGN